MDLLEMAQSRTMKTVKRLEYASYEGRLRSLELFSLEKINIQGQIIAAFHFLKRYYKKRQSDTYHHDL